MMRSIRLELARNPEFPEGSSAHGYELTAPLHSDGSLDEETWKTARQACTVRRFWAGAEDELDRLVNARNRSWAFHYDGTDSDHDEPIFRFDRHRFVEGEYVSITEHDGVQRTFRVVRVR